MEAALKNEELTESDLREIVILLAHYAGWPDGAKLNAAADALRARLARDSPEQRLADPQLGGDGRQGRRAVAHRRRTEGSGALGAVHCTRKEGRGGRGGEEAGK